MKGPSRQAPPVPGFNVTWYSPVTNWNDDPFGADVFEPNPQYAQKKKPPPRPPPPKVNTKLPDVPVKPSHFVRKQTVLTSLLSRKSKTNANHQSANVKVVNHSNPLMDNNSELDTIKMFPRCEPKNVQTAALIDLSSPPSSPTFTTRSSSDGLSVDSFSSDATTSTNHHAFNNGNASQAESGFEDDFDLFLHSRKINKDDVLDDFTTADPFSPVPAFSKPPLLKKPVISKDFFEPASNASTFPVPLLKGPTIIRAKPARPRPPDNSALLKSTYGGNLPVTTMNVNTTTPIHKINNGFGDGFDSKPFSISWDRESSPLRESSPPMPSVPPPPPPPPDAADTLDEWPEDTPDFVDTIHDDQEPYAIALFDYFTDHPEDLCFSANSRIRLIRRVDDEWLFGSLRSGVQGLFPSNYVAVKVPVGTEAAAAQVTLATALYDFEPDQPGDLRFKVGDSITVLSKLNEEWYYGECRGAKGQFPLNYVQMS